MIISQALSLLLTLSVFAIRTNTSSMAQLSLYALLRTPFVFYADTMERRRSRTVHCSVRNLGRPLDGVQNNTRGQQMRTGRQESHKGRFIASHPKWTFLCVKAHFGFGERNAFMNGNLRCICVPDKSQKGKKFTGKDGEWPNKRVNGLENIIPPLKFTCIISFLFRSMV